MGRRIIHSLFIVTLITLLFSNWTEQPTRRATAQGGVADLYMKDTPMDTGVEPNPDTGPMWVTEDIWVRNTPDPNYSPLPFAEASPTWTPQPHENPEYRDPKYGLPNYVYVRVRNRGPVASTGTERLELFWAKASTGLAWPAQWVDYLANNCGPTDLYGAEITKPRKNAATATAAERAAYRDAILEIGTLPGFVFPGGSSYWLKQDEVHQFGPGNRHGTPAFLPWHREMMNRYEVLLQEADPTVKLLYWDWTTDPENSTGGFNFFTNSFMGASGRGTGGVSAGLPFFPALSPPAVTRNLSNDTTPNVDSDATLLGNGAYQNFAPDLESVPNHDSMHGYIGGGGNMSFISSAAEDPFFYLLHTNVDRLWAQWQRDPSDLSRLDPATTYGTNSGNFNITGDMAPWNGTGPSIRPWTVGDGYIVNKSPKHPSVVSPPFYDTAPLVIPALQPGEAVILEIPWYPPNPADFACFGGDQGHFCLLGRIETSNTSPFGMTFPEGLDVFTNTRNNNNIAWKNITVVDNFPGALRLTSILIRNVFRVPIEAGLRFVDTDLIGASFFDFGNIIVDLKPELFQRWLDAGGRGQGVEQIGENRIQVFGADAFIQGIPLEPDETFSVDIHFELDKGYTRPQGIIPRWDLIQVGGPSGPNQIVGGQRFEMDFNQLVLVDSEGDWRYLDDGSDPGADWNTVDYDDSSWKLGQAELGFGDNPVTTIDGGPPDDRHITTYFRYAFDVDDPGFYQDAVLRLKRDDGAIVYLNGTEVHRVNLPAGSVGTDTLATTAVEGLDEEVFFPITPPDLLNLLQVGKNVIAVEVHQAAKDSDDLTFDLDLAANPSETILPPYVRFASIEEGMLFQAGDTVTVDVEATDSDGKVVSVELLVDGVPLGSDDTEPYSFQWSGGALGLHTLEAVATDDDGEQASVQVSVSIVENTPPVVILTEPADESHFMLGETIHLAAEASDPGGAVQEVEFFFREADLFAAAVRSVGTDSSAPYELDLSGLNPGRYMLHAVATDNEGLSSPSMPVHIMVEGAMSTTIYLPAIRR